MLLPLPLTADNSDGIRQAAEVSEELLTFHGIEVAQIPLLMEVQAFSTMVVNKDGGVVQQFSRNTSFVPVQVTVVPPSTVLCRLISDWILRLVNSILPPAP